MASRKDFEIFLYKNKLNDKTLLDLLPRLSSKSIKYIMNDMSILEDLGTQVENSNVFAFTDGGCKNNGKANAKGGYAVLFSDDVDSEYYNLNQVGLIVTEPTNQKAELTAMYHLFDILNENKKLFANKKVIVCTDSMYSLKCVNDWSKKWELSGWKTSKGEPVKNSELIKNIINLKKQCEDNGVQVSFKHVFSHTTAPIDKNSKEYRLWYGNYIVDKMINDILSEQ